MVVASIRPGENDKQFMCVTTYSQSSFRQNTVRFEFPALVLFTNAGCDTSKYLAKSCLVAHFSIFTHVCLLVYYSLRPLKTAIQIIAWMGRMFFPVAQEALTANFQGLKRIPLGNVTRH